MKDKIEDKKQQFLDKYNPNRTIEQALKKALNAAVQHNKLYKSNANNNQKKFFREFWENELLDIYKKIEKREVYRKKNLLHDMIELQKKIRENWEQILEKKDRGFRVSHSQKSISVFLKHLWCMNLILEPEICPVDRIILNKTKSKEKKWTYVKSKDEYLSQLEFIETEAKRNNISLAKFELSAF